MREIAKLGAKLLLISAVAGLLLGATNAVTAGPIQAQSVAAANAARQSVLPSAASFERAAEIPEGIDEIHLGYDASKAPTYLVLLTGLRLVPYTTFQKYDFLTAAGINSEQSHF